MDGDRVRQLLQFLFVKFLPGLIRVGFDLVQGEKLIRTVSGRGSIIIIFNQGTETSVQSLFRCQMNHSFRCG